MNFNILLLLNKSLIIQKNDTFINSKCEIFLFRKIWHTHGNQFSKIINSEMVILTPITINNHFNNANYVTKVDHLCSERHTFNFLLKKVDFRDGIPGQQHLLF